MTQNAKESLRASTLATLTAGGKDYRYYSLPKLAAEPSSTTKEPAEIFKDTSRSTHRFSLPCP